MSGRLGTALGASVLISSPVLWMLQQGTMTVEVALERWAVCLAVCWLAITVIGSFAFPEPVRQPVAAETEEPEGIPVDAP
ncbi:hypothetical protein [Marmoricola sp. URHB0036]|jgi:hypothetical protein|uniref:hypothetical protein n=1 Tax=Marmoricola sp. URHB0036 TaxID=1298863 RepID=UPI00040FEE48|nr:hypothetical protein [Marmoricola sp. URHB0036]